MINSDLCHELLVKKIQPKLQYSSQRDYETWQAEIKEKFLDLMGLNEIAKNTCPLNVQIEWEKDKGTYRLIRFTFDSEVGETVPCYLLIPKGEKKKYPVAITMQGHSTGCHNSIGEVRYEGDEKNHPRTCLALQAVENGYIALAIEQRGMGERKPIREDRQPNLNCRHASMVALALGRTILGERIWDVHKGIDALAYFPECDLEKILITGNSGGGTVSYYAACFDERIKVSVPSCSFSPYATSILDIAHCNCNYLPGMYRYFEMQDLACLIAPRRLAVITGEQDTIFPLYGVEKGYETVREIYETAGVAEHCSFIKTPMGHWWCVDIVWNEINRLCKLLNWK